ncbi:MAG: retropepsin-like aspartic protease [Gemmatimonadaceae bacterium]
MAHRFCSLVLALGLVAACRSGAPLPSADAIVEGRAGDVVPDTVDDIARVSLDRAHWLVRDRVAPPRDFWEEVSVLDLPAAERASRNLDERTFAVALRKLMMSDPEDAAVAFRALHLAARDNAVRSRARVGLTMALSWRSDWPALASIGADPDTAGVVLDSLTVQASVERWALAFSNLPPPVVDVPGTPVTLPLLRSAFGTPIVTVRINGKPKQFWLDTGASMTLVSADVAVEAGVKLASTDSLALGVVAGHIPARAVLVDSLSLGPITAKGLSAALVNASVLRMDRRVVNGVPEVVQIDGVIGTDLLRELDITLDAAASTITIRRPHRDPRAVRNLYWVGYPVVRLVSEDGRPLLFGLDTGAEGTYFTTSMLKKLPRTPVAMRRGTIGGLGSEQHMTSWVARHVALSDGDYALTLENIPVAPERRWTFVTFDGVIGSDVALHARLHLDFLNGVFDVRRSNSAVKEVNVTIGH